MCTSMCKTDGQWEASAKHGELSSALCDGLEGCAGGWEGVQEDVCVYI